MEKIEKNEKISPRGLEPESSHLYATTSTVAPLNHSCISGFALIQEVHIVKWVGPKNRPKPGLCFKRNKESFVNPNEN